MRFQHKIFGGLCVLPSLIIGSIVLANDDGGIGKPLSGPGVLQRFYAGNTTYGTNLFADQGGFEWSEYHCPNGRSIYLRGDEIYIGQWWSSDNHVCYTYPDFDPGIDHCFNIFAMTDGSYVAKNIESENRVTVRIKGRLLGDPLNLRVGHGRCDDLSS